MNLNDGISLVESILITIFSMAIVVGALGVIAVIIYLMKLVFSGASETEKKQVATPAPVLQEIVSGTSEEELVAAAIVAIEVFSGMSRDSFVVRRIRRTPQNASAWVTASRQNSVI